MNWRNRSALVAGLTTLLAAIRPCTPVTAATGNQNKIFLSCDGYNWPEDKGDWMLIEPYPLGMFSLAPHRIVPKPVVLGDAGRKACDEALATGALRPDHTLRRVNILRARALHRLSTGDLPGATADLDLAAAAIPPGDRFHDRSLRLNIDLIRAAIQVRNGDQAGANRLAAAAAGSRPYSRRVTLASLYAMGPGADPAVAEEMLLRLARLDPRFLDVLIVEAFEAGDFEKVIALYPQLSSPWEEEYDLWRKEIRPMRLNINERLAMIHQADFVGYYAYALAATGRQDEALKVIGRFRQDSADASRLAVRAPDAAKPSAEVQRLRDLKVVLARKAASIQAWSALVDLRVLAGRDPAAAATALPATGLRSRRVRVDLVDAILAQAPQEAARLPDVSVSRRELARRPVFGGNLDELVEMLPEPEADTHLSAFLPRKLLTGDAFKGGYERLDFPGRTRTTFWFQSRQSTPAVIEEEALLVVAKAARAAGADGFVIIGRRDVQHIMVNSGPYGSAEFPEAYSTQLDVVFVTGSGSPGVSAWRILPAAPIEAALDPLYLIAGPAER